MVKRANTTIPVHDFIAERWSPRSFDATATVSEDEVIAMLEAARWAPSAMNAQPWRFAIAHRGTEDFDAFVASLMAGNVPWAPRASALIVAATNTVLPDGKPNPWAQYDLGLAVSLLTVQAHAMGLHIHQMGGFDKAAVSALLDLPEAILPLTMLAVGRLAGPEQLESPYLERELAVRERRPLEDLVLRGL